MAVTVLNSGINQEKGITYSAITDSSVDWTGITNSTYFYDKATDLPYYKNSSGTVVSLFEEGGGGTDTFVTGGTYSGSTIVLNRNDGNSVDVTGITSSNISNADLTFDGTHYVDLNSNEWSIKNGSDSYFNIKSTGEFVIGKGAQNLSTSSNKERNVVIGYDAETTASNVYATVSVGNNATTSNNFAVAIGNNAISSGASSIAILGNATKSDSIAIGKSTNATGNFRSIAIGANSSATYNQAVAIGSTAQATHNFAQAFGTGANATQTSALAVGYLSKASAIQGIAIGVNNEVVLNHNNSIVIGSGVSNTAGNQLSSTATNQFVVGFASTSPTILIGATTDSYIKTTGELSLESNGLLMPRLTTAQKNAISSPSTDLMVFDTDLSSLQRYNGSAWVDVAAGVGIIQLTQEGGSGGSVFYTDIQSALTAANSSGGDITITLHDNITTTAAISTNVTTNIDNIIFDLNGFTITNTANDSSAVIYNKLQSNIITIINGSIIKTTGTGNALHFASGIGDLYMSNCYVYSEAGSALKIDASVTPINIWELGNSTFKTNTGYGVYLADTLGGISLTNFISISTGSGMACFLNSGGDVTNFKAIAEGTGTALRVRASVTSATNFYAESNSGSCVLLESLLPMVKDFTAISVSGYAVYSLSSAYKMENFYCKTNSGTHTLYVPADSILINGDVFSDSTDCAFITGAERVENVNFTTNSGANNVVSRFTTNWVNCIFRNKDGVAFYNYGSSTSKLKKCTFISEKTSGGSAHAANIVDGASVVTFVNCDFEVADSTVNCIKANAAMDMKVANCSFDNSATPLSSNITLNHLESDAFGNVTT